MTKIRTLAVCSMVFLVALFSFLYMMGGLAFAGDELGGKQALLASLVPTPADEGAEFSTKASQKILTSPELKKFQFDLTAPVEVISQATLFGLGYVSGFAFHEYGHQTTADGFGVKMDWFVGTPLGSTNDSKGLVWWPYTEDRGELRSLATAGFGSQMVSTEMLLAMKDRNAYTLGWFSFNVFQTLNYVIRNETTREKGGFGDLALYRSSGGNDRILEGILIGHTIFSMYRLISGYNPGFDVRISADRIIISKVVARW